MAARSAEPRRVACPLAAAASRGRASGSGRGICVRIHPRSWLLRFRRPTRSCATGSAPSSIRSSTVCVVRWRCGGRTKDWVFGQCAPRLSVPLWDDDNSHYALSAALAFSNDTLFSAEPQVLPHGLRRCGHRRLSPKWALVVNADGCFHRGAAAPPSCRIGQSRPGRRRAVR